MAHILLLRHGQASFGTHDYDRLSELGRRQSQLLGQHLTALGLRFDAIVSGKMARQLDTAENARSRMGENPPVVRADAAFNEYDADGLFRAYLGSALRDNPQLAAAPEKIFQDRRLFQQVFMAVSGLWLDGARPERGELESWKDFTARVHDGLQRLNAEYGKDGQVAVFTSGGVIAAGAALALSLSPPETLKLNWGIYNASVSEIGFRRTGTYLLGFNNITHLRLAGDPALVTHR